MMVMRWISTSFVIIFFSSIVNAQVVDEVTFTDVLPTISGDPDSRSFVINNSGSINSITFVGTMTSNEFLNPFALDVLFDFAGSGVSGNSIQLSDIADFSGVITFTGVVNIPSTNIETGDQWSFDFRDVFPDSSNLFDLSLDITFAFGIDLQQPPQPPIPTPSVLSVLQPTTEVVELIAFDNIVPPVNGDVESREFTLTNSGSVNAIYYTGVINELELRAFGLDVLLNYAGSGFSMSDFQISFVENFDGSITFSGINSFDSIDVEAGDQWVFEFRDIFDDGLAGMDDVMVNIEFALAFDPPIEIATTNLGQFTLNSGFYDRDGDGIEGNPFTTVDFTVSETGIYDISAEWDDGSGTGLSFDGFLFLFDQPFDGTDDSMSIAFNDDFLNTDISRVEFIFIVESIDGNTASLVNPDTMLMCIPVVTENQNITTVCFDL